ncbi:hypothetical protein AM571_PC00900 (plasmid) [Rhizobium etli 8C-3]|uniref:Uncharacterized protein n=2 Tax=Rhizobium TaxID=379 RepID=A0A4R3RT55_9HYPH|nr:MULTISPECIES: hypothetical protein [Rhizobium]APO78637.1 hypothetical protein AM571_PC00900 [Rhizobium etli 8C-3]TCU24570.1 hypothetical protein EV130_106162 [Rhizobium azibense]TCU39318.1 hypothetical protein EV129_103164 [Rhizobium azibense]
MAKTDWPKEPLTSETLNMLDRVLREWCTEQDCEPSSEAAIVQAKALIDWFEFGVRDEAELSKLLRDTLTTKQS